MLCNPSCTGIENVWLSDGDGFEWGANDLQGIPKSGSLSLEHIEEIALPRNRSVFGWSARLLMQTLGWLLRTQDPHNAHRRKDTRQVLLERCRDHSWPTGTVLQMHRSRSVSVGCAGARLTLRVCCSCMVFCPFLFRTLVLAYYAMTDWTPGLQKRLLPYVRALPNHIFSRALAQLPLYLHISSSRTCLYQYSCSQRGISCCPFSFLGFRLSMDFLVLPFCLHL